MPHHGHNNKIGRKWHRDWRVWVVAILMLLAMVAYVLTLDETAWPRLFGN